jgi:hypothetical protein
MWRVHETACYPNSFKVNKSSDWYAGDNGSCNFFPTLKEAQQYADRRNEREQGFLIIKAVFSVYGADTFTRRFVTASNMLTQAFTDFLITAKEYHEATQFLYATAAMNERLSQIIKETGECRLTNK